MKALEHNIIHQNFRCLRADNTGVSIGIWRKFELSQAFLHVLVTCKNEDDSIKNEWARVVTTFSPLYVYGDFYRRSMAANSAVLGPIWPNFELVRDVIDVLITCKNEEDPIKNEGARVVTRKSEQTNRLTNRLVVNRRTPARWVYYKLTLRAFG